MRIIKNKTSLSDTGTVTLEKEYTINAPSIDRNMCTSNKVYSFAIDFLKMDKESEEYVYMLCLNGRLDLISIFELSHGTVNCSVISSREVFQKALLANAVNIVLIHNHPSGDPSPSKNDINLTNKIKEAGLLMDIELIDHIIIGKNTFVSFKELAYI